MMRNFPRIVIVWASILVISTVATAQTAFRTLSAFSGPSFRILGSEDPRQTSGFAVSFGRPDRRVTFRNRPGYLVFEGYADGSRSDGVASDPGISTMALGVLAYARYGDRFFTDYGVGLQAADKNTHDLPSKLNSTPMFAVGTRFSAGHRTWTVAVRFLHISNAGTLGHAKHSNRGQNQFLLMLGVDF